MFIRMEFLAEIRVAVDELPTSENAEQVLQDAIGFTGVTVQEVLDYWPDER